MRLAWYPVDNEEIMAEEVNVWVNGETGEYVRGIQRTDGTWVEQQEVREPGKEQGAGGGGWDS